VRSRSERGCPHPQQRPPVEPPGNPRAPSCRTCRGWGHPRSGASAI